MAQDLLDSFLNFFPELKEQCVESKAGRRFTKLTVNTVENLDDKFFAWLGGCTESCQIKQNSLATTICS